MWPDHWPAVAREIASASADAVDAARAESADDFGAALTDLAALPFDQVASVQSRVVRELLETLHPDGLESDDVTDAIEGCVRTSAWWPNLDPQVLVAVLIGALGVGDVEEQGSVRNSSGLVEAAALLTAYLAASAKVAAKEYITRSVNEIGRAETVEMP